MGHREANLAAARAMIHRRCGSVLEHSSLYETAAWGLEDQPDFLNQVLLVETHLQARALLAELLEIEQQLGRIRQQKNGPRTIDLDILLYNDEVIHEPGLQIPHPRMASRRFVLAPLAEIAGELIHPVFAKSIRQMLAECPDTLPVNKKTM